MPTKQETFDTVLFALRKQGIRSVGAGEEGASCLYRGTKGAKCAAGHLIPDDQYNENMEGGTVEEYGNELCESLVTIVLRKVGHDIKLTGKLQMCHDLYMPNSVVEAAVVWEEKMRKIAENHCLIYTPPAIS